MARGRPAGRLGARIAATALALALLPVVAAGQGLPVHVLDSLEIERGADAWDIRIRFATPVRTLRHAPERHGDLLVVQVQPIVFGPFDAAALAASQRLPVPADAPVPLEEVGYEAPRGDGRQLVVRFAEPVEFEVRPSRDLGSLVIRVLDDARRSRRPAPLGPAPAPSAIPAPRAAAGLPAPATPIPPATEPLPPPARGPPASPSSEAADLGRAPALLESGREALAGGDLDQAIRLFSKLVSLPEHEGTREAQELLGLARERRGQLAHARAEYEEYLARWPEGEGAARVRQRLAALVTARAELPPRPGSAPDARDGRRVQVLGSVFSEYRREQRESDPTGSYLADSSLYNDATFVARLLTPGWALRSQASGSHLFDFADSDTENRTRVSSLHLDAKQREGPWGAVAGRQPGNTSGLLSRFDGLRVARRLGEHWRLGAQIGMPVDYWHTSRIEPGRQVYGVSLDADRLGERVSGQLFAVQQRAYGMVERTAVGAELRYFDASRFVSAFLDYDVGFLSLNTALLVGNWQIGRDTSLSFMADYRNSPILTATNAIIGQDADDLGDLLDDLSRSEIEDLARDRTARSTMLSLGGTRRLAERLQLGLDVSASKLSDTPASGGVEASEGTDWELSVYPQLIATDLLTAGEITTFGVRWFGGTYSDTVSLILHERYPLTRALRLRPRLRVDWRSDAGRDEFVPRPDDPDSELPSVVSATRVRNGSWTLRPHLGAEYRIGRFVVDGDWGLEWTDGALDADGGDELAWILTFGVRYDF